MKALFVEGVVWGTLTNLELPFTRVPLAAHQELPAAEPDVQSRMVLLLKQKPRERVRNHLDPFDRFDQCRTAPIEDHRRLERVQSFDERRALFSMALLCPGKLPVNLMNPLDPIDQRRIAPDGHRLLQRVE